MCASVNLCITISAFLFGSGVQREFASGEAELDFTKGIIFCGFFFCLR